MSTSTRPGLRTVLAAPGYRRLFGALTISRWGDTANLVGLVVLVFRLTGSGLGVSGAVIAEILPVLLLAPIAGAVVDRLPHARVMIGADLWRMLLAAVLPLVDHHLVAVYAVAFGLSAGTVFFNPAAASTLPGIVAEDELVAANSGLWSAAVISQIALAPAAGALVAVWGVAPAFWFNAATFAVCALILARLRPPTPRHPPPPKPGPTGCCRAAGRSCRTACCACSPSSSCWPPCPPARPAPCSSSSPSDTCTPGQAASGSCSAPLASAPPSARCCWPG
jgi:MFS family permease